MLITELAPARRSLILAHLIQLSTEDRRLRFGLAATNSAIGAYVASLRFDRDLLLGTFDDAPRLLGFGHLAMTGGETAELGLSVAAGTRRQGIGQSLLDRAAIHAAGNGYRRLLMTFFPENAALAGLARRAGLAIEADRYEPRAILTLPDAPPELPLRAAWHEALNALDLSFRLLAAETATSV